MNDRFQRRLQAESQTEVVAVSLGSLVKPGDVIALLGDLGAGKTTFTKGLAVGLAVTDPVSSPTFTIIQEYRGRLPLYHLDVYRLGSGAEVEDLGWDEYFYGDGVTVVEWAELILALLPQDVLMIRLTQTEEFVRELDAYGTGPVSKQRMKEWKQACPF